MWEGHPPATRDGTCIAQWLSSSATPASWNVGLAALVTLWTTSEPFPNLHGMTKKKGLSPGLTMLSVALTHEERAVLHREAERRHVSVSVVVRELLADELDEFRAVTRDRHPGGRRFAT